MTDEEFVQGMTYLEGAYGKPLSDATYHVYSDLLKDLPADAFLAGVKRVALEHRYATFPPVGMIREAALEAVSGPQLSGPEAWEIAIQAVRLYGWNQGREALAKMPATVARAVECFGWSHLCDSTEPEITRAQFLRTYETLAVRERREALYPPVVKKLIAGVALALPKPR